MLIIINGENYQTSSASNLQELLVELGHQGKRVAIEINGEIVSRSKYTETKLSERQKIEIVVAVGGG